MTHDKYDTDILKTLKSIDASLKKLANNIQLAVTGISNMKDGILLCSKSEDKKC